MNFDSEIIKVAYVSKHGELWIDFAEPIKPSYSCAVFVDVPAGIVKEFRDARTAGNGEEYFQQHIRRGFKYYLSLFELCEVFLKRNWQKDASDVATYAQYKAELDKALQEKYNAAMNAL